MYLNVRFYRFNYNEFIIKFVAILLPQTFVPVLVVIHQIIHLNVFHVLQFFYSYVLRRHVCANIRDFNTPPIEGARRAPKRVGIETGVIVETKSSAQFGVS